MLSSSFDEYKEALDILAKTSKHISLITQTIKTKVLPQLRHRRRLLDVGAGAGHITKILQNEFDEVVAIEINPTLKSAYKDTGITLYTDDFMKLTLTQPFDLVLCVHVMYHLNKNEMASFIDKLLASVAPGGYCLIALMAARGQNHRFHAEFNPGYVNSKQIIKILTDRQIPYERVEAHNTFTTDNIHSMRNLLKFFAIEDCQTITSGNLSAEAMEQIEKTVARQATECHAGKGFELQQEEDYFILPAPTTKPQND